jgi:hypothetical protein
VTSRLRGIGASLGRAVHDVFRPGVLRRPSASGKTSWGATPGRAPLPGSPGNEEGRRRTIGVVAALPILPPSDHADGATLGRRKRTRRPGLKEPCPASNRNRNRRSGPSSIVVRASRPQEAVAVCRPSTFPLRAGRAHHNLPAPAGHWGTDLGRCRQSAGRMPAPQSRRDVLLNRLPACCSGSGRGTVSIASTLRYACTHTPA